MAAKKKEEFLQAYVLARCAVIPKAIDLDGILQDAKKAWNEIREICDV